MEEGEERIRGRKREEGMRRGREEERCRGEEKERWSVGEEDGRSQEEKTREGGLGGEE